MTARAKISNPDSGVRGLRPDLYPADLRWLVNQSQHEARAILAETGEHAANHYTLSELCHVRRPWGFTEWRVDQALGGQALAEALAAALAPGGVLDHA